MSFARTLPLTWLGQGTRLTILHANEFVAKGGGKHMCCVYLCCARINGYDCEH